MNKHIDDELQLALTEFDVARAFVKQVQRLSMTPVVDDDFPAVKRDYDQAATNLLQAFHNNHRTVPLHAPVAGGSFFDDVEVFHVKMGLPTLSTVKTPRNMEDNDLKYRTNFIFEEFKEFIEATTLGNVAKAADALADLIWIACGTALYMGIPLNAVWDEVRRANMEKRRWQEGDPVKPRNFTAGEVVKPLGWIPPNIMKALQRHGGQS